MKAAVFNSTGEPENVLSCQDIDEPVPGPGELLVRMLASPINPSDLLFVRGTYAVAPEVPATPGFEGVGVVEAAGSGLRSRLMMGKHVAVLSRRGGNWAEKNVVPASQVIPFSSILTGTLSVEQCATFFVNPATAFIMTRRILQVPPGAWLLQTAAGSELGRMVIRLGNRFDFRTLCVVRRQEQARELEQAGASAVVWFDPAKHDPRDLISVVHKVTNGAGVPFAIDAVSGPVGSAAVQCLSPGARMLLYGTLSNERLSFPARQLMETGALLEGFWLGNYMSTLKLPAKLGLIRSIAALIREGVLASDIGSQFPLARIQAAVRAAEQPARQGKVLLHADG